MRKHGKERAAAERSAARDLVQGALLAVAIGRGEKLLVHRLAEIPFEVQDIIYCIGRESDLMEAASLLSAS